MCASNSQKGKNIEKWCVFICSSFLTIFSTLEHKYIMYFGRPQWVTKILANDFFDFHCIKIVSRSRNHVFLYWLTSCLLFPIVSFFGTYSSILEAEMERRIRARFRFEENFVLKTGRGKAWKENKIFKVRTRRDRD